MNNLNEYTVYFELYGKKMKARILAPTEKDAESEVKNKIIFHKIEKKKSDWNDLVDMMNDIKNELK